MNHRILTIEIAFSILALNAVEAARAGEAAFPLDRHEGSF
jgi:hypothetical protein